MGNTNVPFEIIVAILCLVQVVQALVRKFLQEGGNKHDKEKINEVLENQQDILKILADVTNAQWRLAELLKDIKGDIRKNAHFKSIPGDSDGPCLHPLHPERR